MSCAPAPCAPGCRTDDDRVGTRSPITEIFWVWSLPWVPATRRPLPRYPRRCRFAPAPRRVDGAWGVDAGDDLPYPCEVFRVVGDDDAVVAGVGVDRVVRRNDGAQHRDQVHRVFVLQAEGAGLHAVTTGAGGVVDRPAQQFGVGFRDHLGHAPHVHHAEACMRSAASSMS